MSEEPTVNMSWIACIICQHRRPQWPPCCEPCRRRVRDQLTVELVDQYALLDARPGRADGPKVSGTRTPPLPGRLDVLNLVGAGAPRVHDPTPDAGEYQVGELPTLVWLDQWVRDWRDVLRIGDQLPDVTLSEMVTWMERRLDVALDEHPAVDSFAAELAGHLAVLKRTNGFASDWRKIGTCPEDVDDQTCGTPLYANPWIDIITCKRCGTRWDRREWLWLGSVLRHVDTQREGEGAA